MGGRAFFAAHPAIEATAAIGVKGEIGEQEIKIFINFRPDMQIPFKELSDWASQQLATYQIPCYYKEVKNFEYTPSQRIRKHLLSQDTDDCWTLHA